MPYTVKELKLVGSYAPERKIGGILLPAGKWQHLEPPRKNDEGPGKPKVAIKDSWDDKAKDFTNKSLADNPKIKIVFNQGTVYISDAGFQEIVNQAVYKDGVKIEDLPKFYQQEVLPFMDIDQPSHSDVSGSGAASSSNVVTLVGRDEEIKKTPDERIKQIEEASQPVTALLGNEEYVILESNLSNHDDYVRLVSTAGASYDLD
ncbi:hypothetical protein [Candidatus Tisiphia endosymbiont of Beris chalybata]|uniref:hypothetical protein n=1 Tax=Candidatus Tisiphia endosymbiont of Beris chalybata TaxID=3066262 RepID=UPI00312CA6B1